MLKIYSIKKLLIFFLVLILIGPLFVFSETEQNSSELPITTPEEVFIEDIDDSWNEAMSIWSKSYHFISSFWKKEIDWRVKPHIDNSINYIKGWVDYGIDKIRSFINGQIDKVKLKTQERIKKTTTEIQDSILETINIE
jgi:hypothetical protein